MHREARKMLRPAFVWSAAFAVITSAAVVSIYLSSADWHYSYVTGELSAMLEAPVEYCASVGLPPGQDCQQALEQDSDSARQYVRVNQQRFRLGSVLQHPLGLLGIAAGMVASLAGLLALMTIAAAHVAGEWTSGTISSALTIEPRRWLFVVRKVVSLWFAGAALILVTWLALVALSPIFRAAYEVFPPPGDLDISAFALSSLSRGLLVLLVFASFGTVSGVLARNPLGAFGLTAALVVGSVIVPALAFDRITWSMPHLVSNWMGFTSVDVLASHLWLPSEGKGGVDTGMALAAMAVGAIVLACLRMARGDIRSG